MSDKLAGVHPSLISAYTKIFDAMASLGFDLRVTDGLRTVAQQQALYAKGRTAPGNLVTNADGVIKRSNHQAHEDGFGHALDCTFFVNGVPSWDEKLPWKLYGEMAKSLGCKWGGDWVGLVDKPHIEWP